MNERLKEIAVEAKVEHCVSHVRLQEFAKLIIQECADIAVHNQTGWEAGMRIKEQFGVDK